MYLIFLLSGRDFAEAEKIESKEIKEAKKDAVKEYINRELFRLSGKGTGKGAHWRTLCREPVH